MVENADYLLIGGMLIVSSIEVKFVLVDVRSQIHLEPALAHLYTFVIARSLIDYPRWTQYRFILSVAIFY